MNIWCLLYGHTWIPEVDAPDPHWHTTKKGAVLEAEAAEGEVEHYDRCRRCDERRRVQRPATNS
jgi:hypothetical protein